MLPAGRDLCRSSAERWQQPPALLGAHRDGGGAPCVPALLTSCGHRALERSSRSRRDLPPCLLWGLEKPGCVEGGTVQRQRCPAAPYLPAFPPCRSPSLPRAHHAWCFPPGTALGILHPSRTSPARRICSKSSLPALRVPVPALLWSWAGISCSLTLSTLKLLQFCLCLGCANFRALW